MPERVVAFLLTEVVDSVRRWEDDEAAMTLATERLDDIVAALVREHEGEQVKPRGEGDSHFLVFDDPVDAVACAVALQRVVASETGLPVRSACHVGAAELRGGDWYGTTVNRCARLRAAAHAWQSLVSAEVAQITGPPGRLPSGISLRSLGRHRLKDLDEPTEIFQLCAPGLVDEHPPLATLAQTHGLALPQSTFVGRSAECDRAVSLLAEGAIVAVTGAPGVGTTRFAGETAARWWERERRRVRVIEDSEVQDANVSAGELVFVDGAGAGFEAAALPGPAIVTAREPLGAATETVRLSPLDDLEAEILLKDRLAEDVRLPSELLSWCDGLPLAVELLARRASSVDASVLADRLAADALAVLGGDRHADPPRHASMSATFAAAFEALDDGAQRDLLTAPPGEPRWVAAGWHEARGPLPLVAAFLSVVGRRA